MADAWIELPDRWGPRQVLLHRIAEAGYGAEVEVGLGAGGHRALLSAAPPDGPDPHRPNGRS